MKNTKNSILAFVLATLLLLSVFPASAVATFADDSPQRIQTEDGIVYEVQADNTLTVVDYTGTHDKVTVPSNVDGMPVTTIGHYSFSDTDSLKTITLSEGISTIDEYAFSNCPNLSEVNLPDSLTAISDSSFSYCDSLKKFNIPKGVKTLGSFLFYGFQEVIESINVSPENEVFSSINGVLFDKAGTTLITYPAARTHKNYTLPESTKYIGANAFDSNENIETINFHEGLEAIGAAAFSGCSSLKALNLPDSLYVIGDSAFDFCENLKSIRIGANLCYIDLEQVLFVSKLEKFIVSPDNELFCEIDGVLFDKSAKTLIKYPENKAGYYYDIPEGTEVLGRYSFFSNNKLSSITLPDSLKTIEYQAFSNANNLRMVNFGTGLTLIEDSAFGACSALEEITLPKTITEIPTSCFASCYSLTKVNIPDNITKIGSGAFSNCEALEVITIPSSVTELGEDIFEKDFDLRKITICGYTGSVAETYAKEYNHAFFAISYNTGDANLDGEINVKDATAIQKHLAEIIYFDYVATIVADADEDFNLTIKDATTIQKEIAGLI